MSNLEQAAREVFERQPFNELLGATLESAGPGAAEIALDLDDRLTQHHGSAHGGVLCCLADSALTFAGGLAFASNAVTSELKINYARPAVGRRLIARARAVSSGRRQAVCRAEVYAIGEDGGETLCAVAQGTVLAVSDAQAP